MENMKFKAWDKIKKVIVEVDELRYFPDDEDELNKLKLENIWFTHRNSLTRQLRKLEDVDLIKFIGLHDKNNQEIYTKYIVKIPDYYKERICDDGSGPEYEESHIAEVVYSDKYACYGVDLKSSGEIFSKGFTSFLEIINEGQTIEIIGTVFEDPELLIH